MIKRWNADNNTLESALLDAMEAYLDQQEELRNDILYLAQLTEKLMCEALLHDPTALIKYIEVLIHIPPPPPPPPPLSRADQPDGHAEATLLLAREVKDYGVGAIRDTQTPAAGPRGGEAGDEAAPGARPGLARPRGGEVVQPAQRPARKAAPGDTAEGSRAAQDGRLVQEPPLIWRWLSRESIGDC
ncbi:hypothetical protein ACJ41O_014985 [Fusarium nematophilum]